MRKNPFKCERTMFPTALGFKAMGLVAELKGGGHLVRVQWSEEREVYDLSHVSTKGLVASAQYTQLAAVRKHFNKLKKEIIGW